MKKSWKNGDKVILREGDPEPVRYPKPDTNCDSCWLCRKPFVSKIQEFWDHGRRLCGDCWFKMSYSA